MTLSTTLSLLAAAPSQQGPGGLLGGPIPTMILMAVVFYFLLIRPQQRQRKELAARIAAMQPGDKVVTTAGIHGLIHHIKDNSVMVKVAEGTIIEFDKPAISSVIKKDSAGK